MKWVVILSILVLVKALEEPELKLADNCDPSACRLPDCRCSSTNIPGGLDARDTPQFVILSFDDGVNVININTYRQLMYGRTNSDSCPMGVTFFINHEYTNYQLVNELHNQGYEIALHSISHRTPQEFWASATYEDMKLEFGDQRLLMSQFANIPIDSIKGIRIPFLQLTGNSSFAVIKDYGLTYDLTWPTISHMNPGLWPYTLDYASTQDCPIGPCPTASIPGAWVIPMVSWMDLQNVPCSMVDSCYWKPALTDEDAWFDLFVKNFEASYLGNRAPFGIYMHEWFIATNPAINRALSRFLDLVASLEDAFLVNAGDVIDWVKDPIKIDEYKAKPCKTLEPSACPAKTCNVVAEHNGIEYWMVVCSETCPKSYPWVGNPLGL